MTDVSVHGMATPPGDRLVYVPLEALPKELLSKLGDFKVIVKDDKAGDRIHPKERLGEVLAELNRDKDNARVTSPNSDIYADLTARNLGSRTPPRSPDTTANQLPEEDTSLYSSSSGNRTSPQKITQAARAETGLKSRTRRMFETELGFREVVETRSHSNSNENLKDFGFCSTIPVYDTENVDVYSEPNYGSRSQARVTMDAEHELQARQTLLETTPRKPTTRHEGLTEVPLRKSPRYDESSPWDYIMRTRSFRDQPTPHEMSSHPYGRPDDVIRARKQLFSSPMVHRDIRPDDITGYSDCQKENFYQSRSSPRTRQYLSFLREDEPERSPTFSRADCHRDSTRGYKRKQAFDDDIEFTTHPYRKPDSLGNTRMSTSGISDHLMEMLHPSKRSCQEYNDIGPSRNHEYKTKCACSMMETHFLQMTECAYRNIRRKDSSQESFEQFNRELSQTNSVLKESVNILRAIQQICTHRDVHGEKLR